MNPRTGRCADIPNGEGRDQHSGQAGPCIGTSADNQLWNLQLRAKDAGPDKADVFGISNNMDDLCMDLPDHGPASAGTRILEFTCEGNTGNQRWWLDPRPDGTYWVRNLASNGLCLSVVGAAGSGNDAPSKSPPATATTVGASPERWVHTALALWRRHRGEQLTARSPGRCTRPGGLVRPARATVASALHAELHGDGHSRGERPTAPPLQGLPGLPRPYEVFRPQRGERQFIGHPTARTAACFALLGSPTSQDTGSQRGPKNDQGRFRIARNRP
ncbi:RICIN domain-containing protein [Streptomyces sp. M10(2022)]